MGSWVGEWGVSYLSECFRPVGGGPALFLGDLLLYVLLCGCCYGGWVGGWVDALVGGWVCRVVRGGCFRACAQAGSGILREYQYHYDSISDSISTHLIRTGTIYVVVLRRTRYNTHFLLA